MFLKLKILLVGFGLVVSQSSDRCTTPNRERGTCVKLQNCDYFYTELSSLMTERERRPLLEVIRAHHCGFSGREPKVCCPSSDNDYTTERSTTTTGTRGPPINPVADRSRLPNLPPDISSHPNVRLLAEDCGDSIDNKIVFGNSTSLFEYPWMALISYNTRLGLEFQCGGTVINNRYILTAAHCLTDLGNQRTLQGVRVGEHNISTDEDCEGPSSARYCAEPVQDLRIEQAIPHPAYSRTTLQNDVGLIRVATPINFHLNSMPICLPSTPEHLNYAMEGQNFTITGWGATETGEPSSSLLKISLPIVTNEECGRVHNKSVAAGISFRQVCAGGNGRSDSCGGDSGGPLQKLITSGTTRRTFQYGIVSFGPLRCGTPGTPAVYTRIPFYMDWILDNIRQ